MKQRAITLAVFQIMALALSGGNPAAYAGEPEVKNTMTAKRVLGMQSRLWPFNESNSETAKPMAFGGGTAVEFERRSTLSFNAVARPDGTIDGTLVYMFRDFGADFYVHLRLDCMAIDGNRAKVSGLVTRITANFPLPPFMAVGARGSMQVEDNGTDSGVPDKYS